MGSGWPVILGVLRVLGARGVLGMVLLILGMVLGSCGQRTAPVDLLGFLGLVLVVVGMALVLRDFLKEEEGKLYIGGYI